MHQRVLDAINAHTSKGTKVFYISGNHDSSLKNKRFTDHRIKDSLCYHDKWGKRWLFSHGDQFDPPFLKKHTSALCHLGDTFYDGLSAAKNTADKVIQKTLNQHFSTAAQLKEQTKSLLKRLIRFYQAALSAAVEHEVDGVICGHTHIPELWEIPVSLKEHKRQTLFYGNAGNWTDECSAIVQNSQGKWENIYWKNMRKEFDLKELPKDSDPNPFRAFRSITQKQMSLFQKTSLNINAPARSLRKSPMPQIL